MNCRAFSFLFVYYFYFNGLTNASVILLFCHSVILSPPCFAYL
jgi:hypothetical protein